MNPFMLACLALLPTLAVPLWLAMRGPPGARLVACQFAGAITILLLALMTYAFDQPALIDLAFALSLMSLPGAVLFAIFLERWL